MKFIANQTSLNQALQLVCRVVESRTQLSPILAHVLLRQAGSGGMEITGVGNEAELTVTVDCKLQGELLTTLPARKLTDICQLLPAGSELECNFKEDKATLTCGSDRYVFNPLPVDEFPLIERDEKVELSFSLPVAMFRRMLEKTRFCMASQDVRTFFNGLLLEIDGDGLRAVATDGHRLGFCHVGADELAEPLKADKQQLILPRKNVERLVQLLGESGDLRVDLDSGQACFAIESLVFTSRLLDAQYPDYRKVLPQSRDNRMTADRIALLQALRRAAALLEDRNNPVRLDLAAGALGLQAETREGEQAAIQLEVAYEGKPMQLGFNVEYLIQAVNAIGTEEICMCFTDAESSCLLLPQEGEEYMYVVMPMRL